MASPTRGTRERAIRPRRRAISELVRTIPARRWLPVPPLASHRPPVPASPAPEPASWGRQGGCHGEPRLLGQILAREPARWLRTCSVKPRRTSAAPLRNVALVHSTPTGTSAGRLIRSAWAFSNACPNRPVDVMISVSESFFCLAHAPPSSRGHPRLQQGRPERVVVALARGEQGEPAAGTQQAGCLVELDLGIDPVERRRGDHQVETSRRPPRSPRTRRLRNGRGPPSRRRAERRPSTARCRWLTSQPRREFGGQLTGPAATTSSTLPTPEPGGRDHELDELVGIPAPRRAVELGDPRRTAPWRRRFDRVPTLSTPTPTLTCQPRQPRRPPPEAGVSAAWRRSRRSVDHQSASAGCPVDFA